MTLAADGVDDCVAVADEHFGSACPLEFTLPCLYHALSVASDYHDAVNRALLVGGDSAARTAYLGAVYAAAHGYETIPHAWRSLTSQLQATAAEHIAAITSRA